MHFRGVNRVLVSKMFRLIVGIGNISLALFVAGPSEWSIVAKLMLLISLPSWIIVSPLELHLAQTKERLNSIVAIILLLSLVSAFAGMFFYKLSNCQVLTIILLSVLQAYSIRKEFIILTLDDHRKYRKLVLFVSSASAILKYALIEFDIIWLVVYLIVLERLVSVMFIKIESSNTALAMNKAFGSMRVGFLGFLSHRLDFIILSILASDFVIGIFSIVIRLGEVINQIIAAKFYRNQSVDDIRSFFLTSGVLGVVGSLITFYLVDAIYILLIIKIWLIVFGSVWYWSSLKLGMWSVISNAQLVSVTGLLIVYVLSEFYVVNVLWLGFCGLLGQIYGYVLYAKRIEKST